MNKTDRECLIRVQNILKAVPFSSRGAATSTGYGAIMYEQDMRALRPYLIKILEGIVLQGNLHLVEGEDYWNPKYLLNIIELWIEQRNKDGWQNASEYSIDSFVRRRDDNKR